MSRTAFLVLSFVLACAKAGSPGPRSDRGAGSDGARAQVALPQPPAAAPVSEGARGDELRDEEREADPRSETVSLSLGISPPTRAVVYLGRKRLGQVRPGAMALGFQRPRGSGPMDLVIRAAGFLPHHVRLFTDRDDRLSIRLVRPADAQALLGYRPSATAEPGAPASWDAR